MSNISRSKDDHFEIWPFDRIQQNVVEKLVPEPFWKIKIEHISRLIAESFTQFGQSSFSTLTKSHDQNLNILKTKRAFKIN